VAVHDTEERCVRHLAVWGKRTFVHFAARRFECAHCRKPFTETLAWIEGKRRQTQAFELHVYQRCQQTDQASVAEAEHLHPTTVKDIFYRLAKRAERRHQRDRVRWLGIDEISLKKGHQQFALVLSDLQRHRVIAVLPERSQKALEQWLEGLSVEERTAIWVVAMDMWGPYRGVIRSRLSHAKIVADRFHVMKQLNDRIAQVRRALQAKADPATRETLKGTYWILIKNRADLTPDEEVKLQAALSVSAGLRTAYLLKEDFHTLCEKLHDRSRAERFLRAWVWRAEATGIPQLHKFVQTLLNWWNEFLNYFDERVTSGVVEGLNRAIRAIIRRACGYHVFEHFRLQVLVEHGGLGLPSPPLI
jgi:transposase